jgi:hypothetical protein
MVLSQRYTIDCLQIRQNWSTWKFGYVPHGHWDSTNNQQTFLHDFIEFASRMGVSPSMITTDLLVQYGGGTLVQRYGSKSKLMDAFFPAKVKFARAKEGSAKFKTQQFLTGLVRALLGRDIEIYGDYRHPDLLYNASKSILKFLKICSLPIKIQWNWIYSYLLYLWR